MAEYTVPVRIEIDEYYDVEASTKKEAMRKGEQAAENAYPEGYVSSFVPQKKE